MFLDETASSEHMFKMLKGVGVRLALDDFGTGYSSLGYLKKAPFDKIKIDQSFVRGATIAGNRNAAIIKAIVTLADTLGMETTAEGVEVQDEIAADPRPRLQPHPGLCLWQAGARRRGASSSSPRPTAWRPPRATASAARRAIR